MRGFAPCIPGDGTLPAHIVVDPRGKGSRGPSGFDLRHTLSVNTLYQIPVGHGQRYSTKNGVLDYIVGNWQINNIFTARSGVPFNVFYGASDLANTGNVSWAQYDRANLVGDPNKGSCPNGSPVGSVSCVFNTARLLSLPNLPSGTVDATHSVHPSSGILTPRSSVNFRSGEKVGASSFAPRPSTYSIPLFLERRTTTFRICRALAKQTTRLTAPGSCSWGRRSSSEAQVLRTLRSPFIAESRGEGRLVVAVEKRAIDFGIHVRCG